MSSTAAKKISNIRRKPYIPPDLDTVTKRKARIKEITLKKPSEIIAISKSQNRSLRKDVWRWTTNEIKAAFLIAEDRKSLAEISEEVGIGVGRLRTYLATEGQFYAQVVKFREEHIKRLKERSYANRDSRINVYDELVGKLRDIIRQRAYKYSKRKQPGVNTGLMVRTVKAVGRGRDIKIVRGWDVDKDLIRELRETQKELAIELGQRTEKTENGHMVIIREYKGVDTSQV